MSELQVTLYPDSDYRGTAKTLGVGKYPTNIGISNDTLSSLRIPSGLKVTLCEHANFTGRRCILVRDTPNLGGANDKATSMIIEPIGTPSVIVYSDTDYRGWSAEVSGNQAQIGAGNDLVSSVIVPAGYRVSLCEHENYGGRRCILVRDTPSLGAAGNEATSILVEKVTEPKVILYGDSDFRGWGAEIEVGAHAQIAAGNDRVSSLIVPPGYRVTLYSDGPFKGDTREFTSDAASLGDFNDDTSSIIVDRLPTRSPTRAELDQVISKVAPRVYFHPGEKYLPSSVEWFLKRATLRFKDGSSRPAASAPLPAGSAEDGAYWLEGSRDARGGDLGSAVAYVNAKYNGNWLDVQFWFFHPYNGAGRATVTVVDFDGTIDLDPMGQHGGDWEHVTCRVDPVSLELRAMYLAQHSGGQWVSKNDIPQENGRPVVFSSLNGHASYRSEGSNLSNSTTAKWAEVTWFEFGLLNSTAKGSRILDCAGKNQILRIDFLTDEVQAPDWTKYNLRWGPHIKYSTSDLKNSIRSSLGSIPYAGEATDEIWDAIPDEFKEENGPTGPWMKGNWSGNE